MQEKISLARLFIAPARSAASLEKLKLVVNGVIGNPKYGPNSDLYEAMGYVRESEHKSGLTRKGSKAA